MTKDGLPRWTARLSSGAVRIRDTASAILYAGSMLFAIMICKRRYDGKRVLTNTPPAAFRGHGTANTRHAFENAMDEMSKKLGLILSPYAASTIPELGFGQ